VALAAASDGFSWNAHRPRTIIGKGKGKGKGIGNGSGTPI
jgi:hypothetical protein